MPRSLPELPGFDHLHLIRPPTCVDSSIVVVATDGTVAAFDRGAHELWRRAMVAPRHPMAAQVKIAGLAGKVIVGDRDELIGLRPSDGAESWRTPFPADPMRDHFDGTHLWGYRGDTRSLRDPGQVLTLAVADGGVTSVARRPQYAKVVDTTAGAMILIEEMKRILSVDRRSGDEHWRLVLERPSTLEPGRLARPGSSTLRAADALIVPVTGYGFVAVDLSRGAVVWERDLQVGATSSLLLGDRLHVSSPWRFIELDVATGSTIADSAIVDPDQRRATATPGQIAHHEGVLYGASLSGSVFGWSIDERALIWVHDIGARIEWACPPRVFLDALWIMDAGGALHAFDLAAP